jgi:hypothetical protein
MQHSTSIHTHGIVYQAPVSLPRHHPDVAPLVPERLGTRVLDAALLAYASTARGSKIVKIKNQQDKRKYFVPLASQKIGKFFSQFL